MNKSQALENAKKQLYFLQNNPEWNNDKEVVSDSSTIRRIIKIRFQRIKER